MVLCGKGKGGKNMASNADIGLSYDRMQVSAQQIQQNRDDFVTCVENLKRIITVDLEEFWNGAALDSYQSQFNELQKPLSDTTTMLETLEQQLLDVIEIYREADDHAARGMGVR